MCVCAGSSRLYEDPDVDEYGSMEDVGYNRRSISNQQEFIMSQLDFLRVSLQLDVGAGADTSAQFGAALCCAVLSIRAVAS